jgi:hypothetical protein
LPALTTTVIHGFVNTTVLLFFGIFAFRGWQTYSETNMPQMTTSITKAVLVVILFGGNYLGGKLILQHHIGVKNMEL